MVEVHLKTTIEQDWINFVRKVRSDLDMVHALVGEGMFISQMRARLRMI
jgi:hypothetical protein